MHYFTNAVFKCVTQMHYLLQNLINKIMHFLMNQVKFFESSFEFMNKT